jgi:chemotaxis protein MotB
MRPLALTAALLLGACGVPQEIYNTRVRELDRCTADLTRVQSDLIGTQKNADELATQASDLRDQLMTVESERVKTSRALAGQQENLDLFKNVATLAERRAELYEGLRKKLQPLVQRGQVKLEAGKGRVLIRIPEAALFDPIRAELRPDGQLLLRELAAVMKQVNRDFVVACHSDNQSLSQKGSPWKSAWELTLARSVAVVRYFQGEGVDPRHLAAAGYSEFNYLVENTDETARAQNRRIDLLVMPSADELLPLPPAVDQRAVPKKRNAKPAPAPAR